MDYDLPGSSVHGDSPGTNIGVGNHFLLQGIFTTQESNPGLLPCRRTLYHLSHQGSPGEWKRLNSQIGLCDKDRGISILLPTDKVRMYAGSQVVGSPKLDEFFWFL